VEHRVRKDNTQVSFNELLATPHENLIDIGRSKTLSIPNEKLRTLIAEVDNIKAFYVYDALGKIHQPSKKELKKLLHDLRKLKI
jgi:hypothetical protein